MAFVVLVLASVATFAYLGVERLADLDLIVEREWTASAQAQLTTNRKRVLRHWLALESELLKTAHVARVGEGQPPPSPAEVAGTFVISRDKTLQLPASWHRSWDQLVETLPQDREGDSLLDQAERLEFSGAPGSLEKALKLYKRLATTVPGEEHYGITVRSRANLGAGAVASKLSLHSIAASYYGAIVADPQSAQVSPSIRAMAAHRHAVCLARRGKTANAAVVLKSLLRQLLTRTSKASSFDGIPISRRVYLSHRALTDLRELSEDSAVVDLFSELLEHRLAEEQLIRTVEDRIIPTLNQADGPAVSRRLVVRPTGGTFLAVVMPEDKGARRGVLLQIEAFFASVLLTDSGGPGDGRFVLALRFEGMPEGEGELVSQPLGDSIGGGRLEVLLQDPRLLGEAIQQRRLLLGALLALAGLALAAGATLVLRRLRHELRLSRFKTDLLAKLSHELRTPLTVIRSSAETLQLGRISEPEQVKRYLAGILTETLRLEAMVGNVMEVARSQLGRRELRFMPIPPADLLSEVETARRLYLERDGFTLTVACEQDLPPVRADVDSLRDALLNLVENAVKYSSEQREIDLDARRRESHVVISVADRGKGIDEAETTRIFQRYYRSPGSAVSNGLTEGLGLGLALVLETARSHDGTVEVAAREGGGTIFSLVLPLAEAE